MKKNQITTWLLCLIISYSYGQYGSLGYSHSNSFLTSGKKTLINSTGFVMAGVFPTSTGTQEDFVIQKMDANGGFSFSFTQYFYISSDPTCVSSPNMYQPHKCLGVDVIETNPINSGKYAFAGIFDGGIFFGLLDGSGNIVSTRYWPTPIGAQDLRPTIRESAATPGVFYICGNSAGKGYVIKINGALGTVLWSKWYNNFVLEPNGIIESPYNPAQVIVVGRCDILNPALAAEAFFLTIQAATGNVISFKTYSDGLNGDEWFTSIEPAASTLGGNGFIVGGRVHSYNPALNGYTPWMIKLSPTGNVIWSTLIQSPDDIVDVVERHNAVTPPYRYEYYGLSRSNQNFSSNTTLSIWKLNESGGASASPNVFDYIIDVNNPFTYDYTYPQLEFVGNGLGAADGLVAFGTDVTSNRHILTKAFYNGINGCESRTDMNTVAGPGISGNFVPSTSPFTSPCIYFLLNPIQNSPSYNSPCGWGTPAGGSNAKTALTTGMDSDKNIADPISVYPNPTNGIFSVEVNDQSGPVKISLMNSTGQLLKNIEIEGDPSQKTFIDLKELNLSEGIYFMNATIQNQTYSKKLLYIK